MTQIDILQNWQMGGYDAHGWLVGCVCVCLCLEVELKVCLRQFALISFITLFIYLLLFGKGSIVSHAALLCDVGG